MKRLQLAVFLALAGLGLSTQSAHAGTPGSFVYASGDVLIGFRSTNSGVSTDYLIDVNNAIVNTPAGTTVTIGNFSSDLSGFFDANWFTDGTSRWGVIGNTLTGDSINTLYVGAAQTSASPTPASGIDSSYFGRPAQGGTGSSVNTIGTNFTNGTVDNANNTSTVGGGGSYPVVGWDLQNAGAQGSVSWFGQADATTGKGFSQFVGFEGTVSSTSNGDSLDFYKIPQSASGANTAVLEGVFNVASTGVITYTQAIPVPEPSALAALAGGAALLGMIRRRRAVVA